MQTYMFFFLLLGAARVLWLFIGGAESRAAEPSESGAQTIGATRQEGWSSARSMRNGGAFSRQGGAFPSLEVMATWAVTALTPGLRPRVERVAPLQLRPPRKGSLHLPSQSRCVVLWARGKHPTSRLYRPERFCQE